MRSSGLLIDKTSMPYRSDAQRRLFHVLQQEGKLSSETVKEFDEASKGKKLPERVKKTKKKPQG